MDFMHISGQKEAIWNALLSDGGAPKTSRGSAGLTHKRTKRALRAQSCKGAPSKTGRKMSLYISDYKFKQHQKVHFRFAQMLKNAEKYAILTLIFDKFLGHGPKPTYAPPQTQLPERGT